MNGGRESERSSSGRWSGGGLQSQLRKWAEWVIIKQQAGSALPFAGPTVKWNHGAPCSNFKMTTVTFKKKKIQGSPEHRAMWNYTGHMTMQLAMAKEGGFLVCLVGGTLCTLTLKGAIRIRYTPWASWCWCRWYLERLEIPSSTVRILRKPSGF